ncbi:hypothetical protein GCM10007907_06390 [Chitinimonas prasina]|uniref:TerD family protein n=1 Tax=Chitinimonas prasina TaxID=1434937 RepID=A0ABQ5YFY9_9NEIS|nr:hypothetical protein GCM10007907_06390 [Chitinimonas prasina]
MQKEIEIFGYVFAPELIDCLYEQSPAELAALLSKIQPVVARHLGAHRRHQPLYPNFPNQVIQASEAELYLNAVLHYATHWRTARQPDERPPLLHGKQPRVIHLGTSDEFEKLFTQLAGAKTSLSLQDREDLDWFVRRYSDGIHALLPAVLPFKENLAYVGASLYRHAPCEATDRFLQKHLRTATDVLRFAVALCGGDVSLATACRFKRFARHERRFVLACLDGIDQVAEDMLRWAERWKRLGEVLHPGEYAERYPKAYTGFKILRDGLPYATFNSEIERYLAKGQTHAASNHLVSRPGEFARRLDHLLRNETTPDSIIAAFERVVACVSTPVLLQVLCHFQHRHLPMSLRFFLPKGEIAKIFARKDTRPAIATATAACVVALCESALIARFSQLPALGRCYVDPALKRHLVPMAQRAAAKSLRTLVRGSQLSLPPARFMRLFLWWQNGRSRTDIDLSAVLYDGEFRYLSSLAYFNLRQWGAYHSGDIVDAPTGAAEFIDLDLAHLEKAGVRFIVTAINSYTMQPYCDLPECFAGWMAREDLQSGEVFEPRTVEDRIDLASNTAQCIPFIVDLTTRRIIWADIGLTHGIGWNNTINNLSGISLMLRAMVYGIKPDLHTLFSLHARARGTLVVDAANADHVYSEHEGTTPMDIDRIRADYL